MSTKKFKNETQFEFHSDFNNFPFTMVPNDIITDERLTHNALALYVRLCRVRNIPNWVVTQSSFINKKNGKDKISSAMTELINCGYISRNVLRKPDGTIAGWNYIVRMHPIIVADEDKIVRKSKKNQKEKTEEKQLKKIEENKKETSENESITDIEPKAENPISANPISENPPLLNKEEKNKDIKNKDISTTRKDFPCSNNNNKDSIDLVSAIESKTHLLLTYNMKKLVGGWKQLRALKSIDIFIELEGKSFALLKKIYYDDRNFAPEPKQVSNIVSSTINPLKFNNFEAREYDYDELERKLLGWD